MAGNALKLAAAAIAAVGFVRAAQAHNDFTDRAEYYAATPQAPAYYEPQYYYAYPSYVEPYYSGRSIYVVPPGAGGASDRMTSKILKSARRAF